MKPQRKFRNLIILFFLLVYYNTYSFLGQKDSNLCMLKSKSNALTAWQYPINHYLLDLGIPYFERAFARSNTLFKSNLPLTNRYFTPGKSLTRPPLNNTVE